jgi:hypothetical protein
MITVTIQCEGFKHAVIKSTEPLEEVFTLRCSNVISAHMVDSENNVIQDCKKIEVVE